MKIIFHQFSRVFNYQKLETASLTTLAIKRGLFCNVAKTLKGPHLMGHSDTDLKFSITTDL